MKKAACLLAVLLLAGCGIAVRQTGGEAELEEPKLIALTFDDGPRRETTERLLDGLWERGASATFFVVGNRLAGQEDLVQRMQREGHQIGNHTWSHARLPEEDTAGILEEVQRCQEALALILGEGEDFWLRPPYGLLDGTTGIRVPVIRWSIDPRDWESRDREAIVSHVLREARPGAIILLHDLYAPSVDAALEIVDALQAQGYWFVTVEELLRSYGMTPEAGVSYRYGADVKDQQTKKETPDGVSIFFR